VCRAVALGPSSCRQGAWTRYGREHLAGGILFINEEAFESATRTTFDGNDYFVISIKTRWMEILVQDGNSTYP
jgi:hypothetical protein